MEAELLGNLVNQTSVNPTCFLHKFVVQTFVAKFHHESFWMCYSFFFLLQRWFQQGLQKGSGARDSKDEEAGGDAVDQEGNSQEEIMNQDHQILFLESLVEKADGWTRKHGNVKFLG